MVNDNPYDTACRIDNFWKAHLKKAQGIDPMLASLFKEGIYEIKQHCQHRDYPSALNITKEIIEGFSPKNYLDKPYEDDARKVLSSLKGLESELQEMV